LVVSLFHDDFSLYPCYRVTWFTSNYRLSSILSSVSSFPSFCVNWWLGFSTIRNWTHKIHADIDSHSYPCLLLLTTSQQLLTNGITGRGDELHTYCSRLLSEIRSDGGVAGYFEINCVDDCLLLKLVNYDTPLRNESFKS
jgi:hypothetical protein